MISCLIGFIKDFWKQETPPPKKKKKKIIGDNKELLIWIKLKIKWLTEFGTLE